MTCKPIKDEEIVRELIRAAGEKSLRCEFMVRCQLNLGLRISDIVKLRLGDFERGYLILGRGGCRKPQKIRMSTSMKERLDEYVREMNLSGDDYIFPSRQGGGHIAVRTAQHDIQLLGRRLKLKNFGSHSLRKTFGYFVYERSENILLLMERFSHNDPEVTRRYIGVACEEWDEGDDILDF